MNVLTIMAMSIVLARTPDTISCYEAPTIDGVVITHDGLDGVRYRRVVSADQKGAEQSLPWDAVREVEFDHLPESFAVGISLLSSGDFPGSVESLSRAATQDKRPLAQPLILLALARARTAAAFAGADQEAAAAGDYEHLVAQFPESRLAVSALLELAQLEAAGHHLEQAIATLQRLDQIGRERKLGPALALRVAYEKGMAYLRERDVDRAESAFTAIAAASGTGRAQDLAALARVALADVARERGSRDDAKRRLDQLRSDAGIARATAALALASMGDLAASGGETERADLELTRVRVLFFDCDEACARATLALFLLHRHTPGVASELANDCVSELLRRWPWSRYARDARTALAQR